MKTKNMKKGVLLIFVCMVLGTAQHANAQFGDLPGFEDDVNDEPAAPINGFIGIALAVGAYFGAKKLKKQ